VNKQQKVESKTLSETKILVNDQQDFICSDCSKKLKTLVSLKQHQNKHLAKFKCSCGKAYTLKRDLIQHQKKCLGSITYSCSKCSKIYHSIVTLANHEAKCQTFICNLCLQTFTRKAKLQIHQQNHQPEKPFSCHCSKTFKTIQALSTHLKTHNKTIQCPSCHTLCATSHALRTHFTRKHQPRLSDKIPIILNCKKCGANYRQKVSLYNHEKICQV
jgi:Zinc finger, C2H2 type